MTKAVLTGLVAVCAVGANAAQFIYTAALNGFQEAPMTPSQGIGTIVLTLDDVANTASGTGSVSFLTGPPVDFHIHEAPYGVSGPVRIPIGPTAFSAPNAQGVRTINFSVSLPINGISFAQLKTFLDARNGYFNIHTSQFPSGEIRGQIMPVPEPGTIVGIAVGTAALLRRRRRKI